MKNPLTLLPLFAAITCSNIAAATSVDTAFNPLKPTIHNSDFSIQADIGVHNAFYISAGIAGNMIKGSGHGNVGYNYHLLAEFTPAFKADREPVYGLNAGGLLMASLVVFGADIKYITNFSGRSDVLIVPKVGIGFGNLNLTYGYQLSTNGSPFDYLTVNQVALSVGIPLKSKNLLKK